jgi:hypothetical protein
LAYQRGVLGSATVGLRRLFWRYAHRRYQTRKPSVAWETIGFGAAIFFGFVYAVAFWQDFRSNLEVIPGVILFVVMPLALAIAHRRVRLERAKGRDALYRKLLATNG